MDDIKLTSDLPEPKCVGETVGNETGRRQLSAWQRAKRALTCGSCRTNDSDCELSDTTGLTIIDVPLCSGDKNLKPTEKTVPAVVDHGEESNCCSSSKHNPDEDAINQINFSEEMEKALEEWLSEERTSEGKLVGMAESEVFETVNLNEEVDDIPKAEQASEGEGPSVETHLAPSNTMIDVLASPHEVHIQSNNDEVGVVLLDATNGGECPVQEFLQEVISERQLIAKKVEIINGLLARECHAIEVDNAMLLATLDMELNDEGSEVNAGLPSVKVFTDASAGESDGQQVRASAYDVPSQEELAQIQEDEEIHGRDLHSEVLAPESSRTNVPSGRRVDCETEAALNNLEPVVEWTSHHTLGAFVQDQHAENLLCSVRSRQDCKYESDDSKTKSLEVTGEVENLVASESPLTVKASTHALLVEAEETPIMNVLYDDHVQNFVNGLCSDRSTPEVCEGDARIDGIASEVCPEDEQEAPGQSESNTVVLISKECTENVRLEFFPEYQSEVTAEDKEVASILEAFVTVDKDKEAAAKINSAKHLDGFEGNETEKGETDSAEPVVLYKQQPLFLDCGGQVCSPRWRADSPWPSPPASPEFIQEVADEVIDPMLAKVIHFLENGVHQTQTVDTVSLTIPVENADTASHECLQPPVTDNDCDALVTALETADATLSTLEEACRGCLQPSASASNLDSLVAALETTESVLADLKDPSLGCLVKKNEDLETTHVTSLQSPMTDKAVSLEVTETALQTLDQVSTTNSLECGLPPMTDEELMTSLTGLLTASLANLNACSSESSVIDLTMKPSMMDLGPTPSLAGLAVPSDASVVTTSSSHSMEDAAVGSMAVASSSAEWPDQGKEQHRAARNNNKRNKKRNRRGKK